MQYVREQEVNQCASGVLSIPCALTISKNEARDEKIQKQGHRECFRKVRQHQRVEEVYITS